ncbi:hypothetical protein ABFS83_03G101900 [Erythranthe nasuta]
MWTRLVRSALIRRRAAFPSTRPPILHRPIPHRETVSLLLPSTESASRFSHFSAISHFHQSTRLFSSDTAKIHEEPPSEPLISEANEITGDSDFGAMNAFDENAKSELEDKDFSSESTVDYFKDVRGLDEDDGVGQVKENDPEKVETLLSLLQSSGTANGSLESDFERMNLGLNDDLVLKVLETQYIPGENLMCFFSWILKKPEFKLTTVMLDAFVSAICTENRRTEAYALWDLVNEVGDKENGLVSTKSLNSLIEVFSRLGKAKAAFDVLNKFEELGCVPNADTYYSTLEVLCKRSFYTWACSVCEKMLSADKLPDAERVGKIISSLCKGGMMKDAHLVYLYAKDKKICPPQSSIDFLIGSLSRIERAGKGSEKEIDKELDKQNVSSALEMLNDYPAEKRKYAIKPFSSVINKMCWIEDVEGAKKLLLKMVESGPHPGNAVFNCVINGLAKAGDIKESLYLIKVMKSRGLKPDVYTYSVIMSSYARGGEMEKACKIFAEAKKNHSKLTTVTYHTLIRGFCKLEQFDKAVDLLREMKKHGVHPNHDEYNKMIKSLCLKALDWETAAKLEKKMRKNGLILNGRTRALISAVKELDEGVSSEISGPA